MSPTYVNAFTFPAAFALLPPQMDTPEARAMLLAIGLQESRFAHRRQIRGPARGYYQFEVGGGVTGVLTHPVTKPLIELVLEELCYVPAASACYDAIEHNDVLATVFARLLLYTLPGLLPKRHQAEKAWNLYIEGWRPGRPHKASWSDLYVQAWTCVAGPAETVAEP